MTNRPEWLDRVLDSDERPEEEQAGIRAFLAENEEARRLLDRVRAVESEAVALGELPQRALSAEEATEASESLAALLREVSPPRSSAAARPPVARRLARLLAKLARPWVLVPVAAAAVALLMLPLRPQLRVGPLVVVSPSAPRGGDAGRTGWRTGDAFVLQCRVSRASALILVHVDAEGSAAVLVPETDADAGRVYGPGDVELPGPDEEWVFQGTTGVETFLLAVRADGSADETRSTVERARQTAGTDVDRDARVRDLRRILESFGEVRTVSVDHRGA